VWLAVFVVSGAWLVRILSRLWGAGAAGTTAR
jgi:hypothetical protein